MSDRPPELVVWDFQRGALMARALALAADLGVAEVLADGARHVDEVAREVGADADALRRVLRALASDGVFAEEEPRVFGNTPASERLRDPSERAFAHLFGGIFYRAAGELDASGVASFPRAFGDEFWSWLAAHPNERAAFDAAMGGGKEHRVKLLEGLSWRGDETVVDVGGGDGSLLVALLERKPTLRGIVLDLPETVRDEEALGDRIDFVEGSFFDSVPRGDVYILGTILHDWNDDRAAAILRTIRRTAPPDARLVVFDAVVPPGNEPHWAKWLDLLMLALFEGAERDERQWQELLSSSGFEPVRIEDSMIEARCR